MQRIMDHPFLRSLTHTAHYSAMLAHDGSRAKMSSECGPFDAHWNIRRYFLGDPYPATCLTRIVHPPRIVAFPVNFSHKRNYLLFTAGFVKALLQY